MPDRPYIARPYPEFAPSVSPYAHLERVKAWALAPEDDEA
jgi:hypothetical protein